MFNSLIKPMEPQSFPHAFDSENHVFQVKWDGVRMLAFVSQNHVRLQNRKFKDRTLQYPEMQILAKQVKGHEAILDGEMIALKNGKPDFSTILQRDLVTNPGQIRAALHIPAIYMIFDILYYNGNNLTSLPWNERNGRLSEIVSQTERIHLTESIFHRGKSFYQAIQEQGLEGMIAKNTESSYIIGGKTSSWLKIKPRKDINCVVGGFVTENHGLKSLLVGAYRDGELKYLGKVSSGLSQKELATLQDTLPRLLVEESPYFPAPGKQKNWHWIKPVLTVKVEFLEFTAQLQLRQPIIKGFTDTDPQDCVLSEE